MTSATEIDGVNAALAVDEEGLFSSEFRMSPWQGIIFSLRCSSWPRRCMGRIEQIS